MPCSFFLRGKLLGTDPHFDLGKDHTYAPYTRANLAFVCPICGELWARILYTEGREWVAGRAYCDQHPDDFADRGSFFQHDQHHHVGGLSISLPHVPQLLAWELELATRRKQ